MKQYYTLFHLFTRN